MSFVMRLCAAPTNKIQVEPYLMMAALVSRADTKSFMENGEWRMRRPDELSIVH